MYICLCVYIYIYNLCYFYTTILRYSSHLPTYFTKYTTSELFQQFKIDGNSVTCTYVYVYNIYLQFILLLHYNIKIQFSLTHIFYTMYYFRGISRVQNGGQQYKMYIRVCVYIYIFNLYYFYTTIKDIVLTYPHI